MPPKPIQVEEPTTSTHVPIPLGWQGVVKGIWAATAVFCIGLFIAGIPTRFQTLTDITPQGLDALSQLGISPEFQAIWLIGVEIIFMLGFTLVGIIIYLQKSDDFAIVTISLMLVTFGTTNLNIITSLASVYPYMEFPTRFARFLSWTLLIPAFYTFPNGKWIPRWTRWLALAWLGSSLAWLIFPKLPNNPTKPGMLTQPFWFWFYLAWFISGLLAQIYRYKNSPSQTQKQQTKWIVFGFAIAIGGTFLEELPAMINQGLMVRHSPEGIVYHMASVAIFILFVLSVPTAISFSIRRNRLWDIDFVINRSLTYSIATVLLSLVFGGIFIVLQNIFITLTGGEQSIISIAAATLVVVSLFQPVKTKTQTLIDRHLYDIHIAYQKVQKAKPLRVVTPLPERTSLGDYYVMETIGRGGMAEIVKGRHKTKDLEVAIKILSSRKATEDESFRKRFAREAEVATSLNHPNIIKAHKHFESDEICYIIMDYVPGINLSQTIKEYGPMEIEEVQTITKKIASALDFAHERGIVHRDIKPSNVMLRKPDGSGGVSDPVLTDFGIAKVTSSVAQITQTEIIGTFDFIAPEQISASSDVDGRADIYSLGIMTFQMLTGKLPFPTRNPGATLIAHLTQPAPSAQDFREDVPENITRAIKIAMEKNPENRYQTAGEFAEALG